MNRITGLLIQSDRRLLIPFFTAGFPDTKTTKQLVATATDSGADVIEIGMPFSDPLADGPEIQFSSHEALGHGVTLRKVLDLVSGLRATTQVPLVLMGYLNPLLTYGLEEFCRDAQAAGVDGLIIPDLPPDEAREYCRQAHQAELSTIFLVAPTTDKRRLALIDRNSSDLVYAVSITGVTGIGKGFDRTTDHYLKTLKQRLIKPFVVGFGISSSQDAARLARYSRGVVVGSALVRMIRESRTHREGVTAVGRKLAELRRAL